MMRRAISVALVGCCLALAAAARPGRVQYGGVYLYRFTLNRDPVVDEERWQRLLQTPAVTYLCSQVSAPDPGEVVVRRVREAAAAGKRVVLQIWWGGSGRLNWSKFSLANIAMDAAIREEFFAQVVDPLLAKVGSQNVYGAHLLEETGMQFGVDLDVPGVPADLTDGDDNGSNWDQPSWFGYGGVPGYIGGPYVPNIRRYNEQFRKDTGFDMREAALWPATGGWAAYREWVSWHLEAGAMNAFAAHLHRKYPRLKAFTWDAVNWGGAGAGSMRAMKGKVDGLIMDPYTVAPGIYAAVRAPRLIDPDLEIIAVLWGCDDQPAGELVNRAAAAYAGGVDVIGFYGDTSIEKDEAWRSRVAQFAEFARLPPFEPRPSVLLIVGHASWESRLAGFACYDVMSAVEAEAVGLSRYDLVVCYGAAVHPGLKEYVRRGGRVLASVPPPFLTDEGLVKERLLSTYPRRDEFEFRPNSWWREQMHLAERYSLDVTRRVDHDATATGAQKDYALLVPYGKGEVCIVQHPNGWEVSPPERLDAWRRFHADLARGLLLRAGRKDVAATAVYDPEVGPGYLRIPNRKGDAVVWCMAGKDAGPAVPLNGLNLIGPDTPVLGKDVRAAVMKGGE